MTRNMFHVFYHMTGMGINRPFVEGIPESAYSGTSLSSSGTDSMSCRGSGQFQVWVVPGLFRAMEKGHTVCVASAE